MPPRTRRPASSTDARALLTAGPRGGSHGSPGGAGSGAIRSAASMAASAHCGPPDGAPCTRPDTSQRPSSCAASTSGTPTWRSTAQRRPRSSARSRRRPVSVTARSTTRSASTPWRTPSRADRSLTDSSGCCSPSSSSRATTRARTPSSDRRVSLIAGNPSTQERRWAADEPKRPAMLGRMDLQTASGPALPLGIAVAVGVLALALAAALVISWRRPPRMAAVPAETPSPGTYLDDDLPAFREHPPGFPGARPVPAGTGGRAVPATPAAGRNPVRMITVMALLALLFIGAAAAGGGAPEAAAPPPAPPAGAAAPPRGPPARGRWAGRPPPAGVLAARGAFGGVVLARHPAGITVTYPTLTVALTDPTTAQAHVQLPTWNCMTDRPPPDPASAGCRATVAEYADLPAPALRAARVGGGLQLHGRFPTYVRPPSGEAVPTGRVYDLAVTLRPDGPLPGGWTAASGELSLAGAHAASLAGDATALLPGD